MTFLDTDDDFFDVEMDQAHNNGIIFITILLIELDNSQPDGSSFSKSLDYIILSDGEELTLRVKNEYTKWHVRPSTNMTTTSERP
jgi:hypothetical protein